MIGVPIDDSCQIKKLGGNNMGLAELRIDQVRGNLSTFMEIRIGESDEGWYAQTADLYDETNLASSLIEPTDYRTALKVASNVSNLTGMRVRHWDTPQYRIFGSFNVIQDSDNVELLRKLITRSAIASQIDLIFLDEYVSGNDTKCKVSFEYSYDQDISQNRYDVKCYLLKVFSEIMADVCDVTARVVRN